jgi:hypothetical protein
MEGSKNRKETRMAENFFIELQRYNALGDLLVCYDLAC